MLQGRVSFGACLLKGERVIVCGGAIAHSAITGACEMYCCRKDEWRQIQPMLIKKVSCSVVGLKDQVYVFGGKSDRECYLDTIEVYRDE